MATVEVNGARLWYDEAGDGPTLLLLHGGLGDSELWEPVVPLLAERFRTVRMDHRFYGRSTGPAIPWSETADVIGVLDGLGIERAAVAGLSMGGRIAVDVALAHPERVTALCLIAPGLGGRSSGAYTAEMEKRFEAAEAEGDFETMLAIELEPWAPLGADERIRRLWHATPSANALPDGVEPLPAPGAPASERLDELSAPTLVVTVAHDPAAMRETGPLVAENAPNARHAELDSDHYVTLREPELVARTLLEFLTEHDIKS